jgi:hypothetical protein
VRETFSAVADTGTVTLSLAYDQGGDLVIWAIPTSPTCRSSPRKTRASSAGIKRTR